MKANEQYYSAQFPEDLEFVDELGEGGYDWSIVAVFKQGDKFYFGAESGCSCYGPFEYGTMADLTPLTLSNWSEFDQAVHEISDYYARSIDKVRFLADINSLVRA